MPTLEGLGEARGTRIAQPICDIAQRLAGVEDQLRRQLLTGRRRSRIEMIVPRALAGA